MRPNVAHGGQIVHIDGHRDVLDDPVDAESLVFVRFQIGVERFEAAGKAPEQHILADQRVDVLDVRHSGAECVWRLMIEGVFMWFSPVLHENIVSQKKKERLYAKH